MSHYARPGKERRTAKFRPGGKAYFSRLGKLGVAARRKKRGA